MLFTVKALFIFLNTVIGFYDFSFYRIPNILLGGLIVLYGLYAPFFLEVNTILSSLAICVGMLVFSIGLFAFKFIGAGDAKYLAVASLWVGPEGIVSFILICSLLGGGLALFYLFFIDHLAHLSDSMWRYIQKAEKYCPFMEYIWIGSGKGPEKNTRANIGSRSIPYGVAIALGAILTMLHV